MWGKIEIVLIIFLQQYLKLSVLQITRMHFQWDWLCLGVLIINSVTAEIENEETLDADVEVEDFDKQSQEADVDRDKSSLEVRLQKSLVKASSYN